MALFDELMQTYETERQKYRIRMVIGPFRNDIGNEFAVSVRNTPDVSTRLLRPP